MAYGDLCKADAFISEWHLLLVFVYQGTAIPLTFITLLTRQ